MISNKISTTADNRDDVARAARAEFKEADDAAKEVEKEASRLRSAANDKKKIANEKKDAACETRLGGKVVCIRPLNSGY